MNGDIPWSRTRRAHMEFWIHWTVEDSLHCVGHCTQWRYAIRSSVASPDGTQSALRRARRSLPQELLQRCSMCPPATHGYWLFFNSFAQRATDRIPRRGLDSTRIRQGGVARLLYDHAAWERELHALAPSFRARCSDEAFLRAPLTTLTVSLDRRR